MLSDHLGFIYECVDDYAHTENANPGQLTIARYLLDQLEQILDEIETGN